ncbi:MAG TPA: hypothetical protein VFI17_04475 [Solirubrobacterales bacterium]|nr:hypothetical protein [Solirubrobacterales bacterium]
MILLALGLIGFGVGDLVRWSPERNVSAARTAVAAGAGAAAVALVAALSGMAPLSVLLAAALALALLGLWLGYDLIPGADKKPELALGLVLAVVLCLVGVSGAVDPVAGDLERWYGALAFGFTRSVSVDQFLLGVGATLFILATGNRLVRYTLAATKSPADEGEIRLRGGRLLGPMERLLVAASVVAGGFAGAGFVIAAKGLLRFRELRDVDASGPKLDSITEYFLIGTFTSVLIAAVAAVLVLAAG